MTKIMWLPMCKTKTHNHQLRQRFFMGVRGPSISTAFWIKYVNFLYFYNHICINHIVKRLNTKYKTLTYLSIQKLVLTAEYTAGYEFYIYYPCYSTWH